MTGPTTGPTTEQIAEPEARASAVDWSKLGWGLAILFLGLLLVLDQLDFRNLGAYWRYTPLILIACGLVGLRRSKSAKERDGSWWLLGIGVYLLVNFLELWGLEWGTSWPLILILIGLACLIDPHGKRQRADSLWLLGLGVLFLLGQGNFFDLDFSDLWPLILVAVGASMVWKALLRQDRRSKGVEK